MSDKYDWRYENSINNDKNYLEVNTEEKYVPGRTNKVLSNYIDTVLYSNCMNLNRHLDDKLQYDYLFHSIKKRKRFFKKNKHKPFDDLSLISDYYKYNRKKSEQALKVLSKEQIIIIKDKLQKGGTNVWFKYISGSKNFRKWRFP